MCLRWLSGAGQGQKAERGTEPEGPGKAFLSVPAAGGLAWSGRQDGRYEIIAGRLNELATGGYFCGIGNEELLMSRFPI